MNKPKIGDNTETGHEIKCTSKFYIQKGCMLEVMMFKKHWKYKSSEYMQDWYGANIDQTRSTGKYANIAYKELYTVTAVHNNGTVRVEWVLSVQMCVCEK